MDSLTILDSQFFFFMLHQMIGGSPLVYSVYLKGSLDRLSFETAVQNLIRSNPVLQFTFDWPKTASSFAEFTTKRPNSSLLPITWENLTETNPKDQEVRISQELDHLLNHRTLLNSNDLYSFKVFEMNKNLFCVVMSIHHVICDGLSSLQLLHELLCGLAKTSQLSTNSIDHYNEVAKQIHKYHPLDEYLVSFNANAKSKKDSFQWNPNQNQLQYQAQQYQMIRTKIDRHTTQKLIHLTERLKVSLYSILVTTYVRFLFATQPHDKITLTLPTSGRHYPYIDAVTLVGCYAQALSLTFERPIVEQTPEEEIQTVHQAIQSALLSESDLIQNQKVAQTIKSEFKLKNGELSPLTKVLFRNAIKSNFYVSFTGYSPLQQQYGNLQVLDYQEATFNNSGVSDWMHTIFQEELHIFANFDALFFSKETILTALSHIRNQLYHIVHSFSSSVKSTKVTPFSEPSTFPLYDYLLAICTDIGLKKIDRTHVHHDLEAQLGLDSLNKIRLISKISKDYSGKLSKNALFMCRTLDEFATVIKQV